MPLAPWQQLRDLGGSSMGLQAEESVLAEIDFSQAKPAHLVPALARIQQENACKARVTICLDTAALVWFREQVKDGGNYQSLINEVLKAHVYNHEN